MVEHNLAKVDTRVRFPSPAPVISTKLSKESFFCILTFNPCNLGSKNDKMPTLGYTYDMKIRWLTSSRSEDDIEIEIRSPENHPQKAVLEKMLSHLEGFAIGEKNNQQFRIFYKDIYYVDYRQDQAIIHTKSETFYSHYRLYEVESFSSLFVRIHKSIVVNITKIKSFRSTFNGKLEVTLLQGENLEISRSYVNALKQALKENQL